MSITTLRPTGFNNWEFKYCPALGRAISFKDLASGFETDDELVVSEKWNLQRQRDAAALEAYALLDAAEDQISNITRTDTEDVVILTLGEQTVQVAV